MGKKFNTILIPVDFSVNTDVAISKALDICPDTDCSIHLFHVQGVVVPNFLRYMHYFLAGYSRFQVNSTIADSMERLNKIKSAIENVKTGITVFTWASFGEKVEKAIADKAVKLGADLVIIGKRSHHRHLPFLNTVVPGRLASQSGVPVLMAKPGSLNKKIETVVIPVGDQFPANKLEMIEALRKESMLQIRLVVFAEDEHEVSGSKQSLLSAFRMLKSQSQSQVNYEILKETNKAKALLGYCSKVDADLLVVYPGIETRVGSWFNIHISDLIPASSKTQVLSVNPFFS